MGTPYQKIYNKFLSKVNDDEWSNESDLQYYEEDWVEFLHTAISLFKFPRFSIVYDDNGGEDGNGAMQDDLTEEEINIIANLMKQEWLDRNIHTWDQIKTMYDERDFSQANMLRQLVNAREATARDIYHLQKIYSRSILGDNGIKKPFNYRMFGGTQ